MTTTANNTDNVLMPPAFLATMQTGHIGLNVTDLARSRDFYTRAFGLNVMHESHEEGRAFVFLGDGKRLVLTLWQQGEGAFSPGVPGLHHLSFQVNSIEAVREAEGRLRGLDAHFFHEGIVPHSEGGASGGIFFADPDGIRLEIYAPSGAEGITAPTPGAPTCGFF